MTDEQNDNGFGAQTYWNRPAGVRPASTRYVSKYGALMTKEGKLKNKSTPPGGTRIKTRLPSPTPSQQSRAPSQRSAPAAPSLQSAPGLRHSSSSSHFYAPPQTNFTQTLGHTRKVEDDDAKDEKAIQKAMKGKLPEFSDEKDWETAIFELQLVLARYGHIKRVWISLHI